MAEAKKSVFETLYALDVTSKIKEKNGLSYLPWACAWAEVMKLYPGSTFDVAEQVDERGNGRPWFDDGNTGWVKTSITIEDVTRSMNLPIMDFKNKSIPRDNITSMDANKAMMRCLVKNLALFGLGLFVYEGEDTTEEVTRANELKTEIVDLIKKKCGTEAGKAKVKELCVAAEKSAFPLLDDDAITGEFRNIDDVDVLENLKKKIMAIRAK